MKKFATAKRQLELLVRDPILAFLVGVIFLSLAIFVVYPLATVLAKSFQNEQGVLSLENYVRFARFGYLWSALWNSVLVGVVTGVVSVFLGYSAAFTIARTNIRLKKVLQLLYILPIISPPFTSALSVLMLLGANGLITRKLLGILDYNIYGFKGVMLSQVFTFAPVAYLTLKGVLDSLNPTLEDAAMNVGASRWQTFRKVTFPLSLPGIASAFLVVFIESLADFGNPLVLAGSRFPMLSTQAYLEITGSFNLPLGAALAVVLMLPSVTAFAVQRYYLQKRQYTTVTGKPTSSSSKLVSRNARLVLMAFVLAFATFILLFYGTIFAGAFTKVWGYNYGLTLRHFTYALSVGVDTHQGYARSGPGVHSAVRPDGHAHCVPGRSLPVPRERNHGVHVHPELCCSWDGGRHRLHPRFQPAPVASHWNTGHPGPELRIPVRTGGHPVGNRCAPTDRPIHRGGSPEPWRRRHHDFSKGDPAPHRAGFLLGPCVRLCSGHDGH